MTSVMGIPLPDQLFMLSNVSGISKSFSLHKAITACRSSIFLPFTWEYRLPK